MGRRADTRYDDVEEERLSIAPQLRWQPDVSAVIYRESLSVTRDPGERDGTNTP